MVTKLFSFPRQKFFEKLEGWFLLMLVGHASASGTGKMKDGSRSSFVSLAPKMLCEAKFDCKYNILVIKCLKTNWP